MTFDIRQLRYAIAVADHGSFYRAARAPSGWKWSAGMSFVSVDCGANCSER
jgi:hypothetical protein